MILIFDASIEGFAVGLFQPDGKLLHQITNEDPYSHTQWLVPTIQQLMEHCNINFKQLSKIITTKGPGSFTGIRVGLATAAGFQAALDIPTITVNTLTALSYAWVETAKETSPVFHTVLDTKCKEVYHQTYNLTGEHITAQTAPVSIPLDQLKEITTNELIITHPTSAGLLKDIPITTTPLTLTGILKASHNIQPSDLQPLYVRPANVAQPKKLV